MNSLLGLIFCFFVLILHAPVSLAQHQGHQMPAPKPTPTPSPPPTPSASPVKSEAMPAMPGHPASHNMTPSPSGTPAPASTPSEPVEMDMGPLLVMKGEEMFVRVGNRPRNLIPMGRMGSGTSWQPASTAMPMIHKQFDEWLVMFHYNLVAGVN